MVTKAERIDELENADVTKGIIFQGEKLDLEEGDRFRVTCLRTGNILSTFRVINGKLRRVKIYE